MNDGEGVTCQRASIGLVSRLSGCPLHNSKLAN
jgi:hypothetical protein